MDQIRIRELKIYAHHGVYDFEKEKGQNFFVNATLCLNAFKAGESDLLDNTVNYAAVCEFIEKFLTENTFDLLEAACQGLCEALLLRFEKLKEVEIEIRKPEAPINLEFESVSVVMKRGWHKVVLSMGSNIGDRDNFLNEAIDKINLQEKCRVTRVSDIITTRPYGLVDQDDFRNVAVCIETLLSPFEMLELGQRLEKEAERVREIHWGPRTLDVDIIFYDDLIIREENLIVPHIDMENRFFVLVPLKQIAPGWIHPIYGKTVNTLYEELRMKKAAGMDMK